jgi:hypothetical protein
MNRSIFLTALAAVLATAAGVLAQSPPNAPPAMSTSSCGIELAGCRGNVCVTAPVCGPTCAPAPAKICVSEMKPTIKTVYRSACVDFCLPKCSLHGLWQRCCGECDTCHGGECELRTRRVLIKKFVPGCEEPVCVLKDAPTLPCGPGMIAPPTLIPAPPTAPPAGKVAPTPPAKP